MGPDIFVNIKTGHITDFYNLDNLIGEGAFGKFIKQSILYRVINFNFLKELIIINYC